jgi:hypothetical protein
MYKITELVRRDRRYVSLSGAESAASSEGESSEEDHLSNPHVSSPLCQHLSWSSLVFSPITQELFRKIVKRVSRFCPTLPMRCGTGALDDDVLDDPEATLEDQDRDLRDDISSVSSTTRQQRYDPRMDPANWEH